MQVDYEIYPYAEKSRRLFIELLELAVVSFSTFLLFAVGTSNIIKSNPTYQAAEQERVESRNDLYRIGKESKLVVMYNETDALGPYDMFVRFSYKCIHRSFELYEQDFQNEGFTKIVDPYNLQPISKENDELLYFFTTYAVENGLIETTDPINNYRNNILDLEKHGDIMVYNETLECFILNNEAPSAGGKVNFAVALYKELYDDNKSFAMNSMYKLYNEYYSLANEMLEQVPAYQEAYSKYQDSSLKTSKFISYGMLITYIVAALPYFFIMPFIRKAGQTPMRLFTHVELTDKEGNYLPWWKKLIYYLAKFLLSFFSIFILFQFGYGQNIFLSPFGIIGNAVIMPIHIVAITGIIWAILGLCSFIPALNAVKTTPIEYALGIRTADRRMDFEDKEKDYKKSKKKKGN